MSFLATAISLIGRAFALRTRGSEFDPSILHNYIQLFKRTIYQRQGAFSV